MAGYGLSIGPRWEKTCLRGLRTLKAQTSLRGCAGWSVPLLSLTGKYYIKTCYKRNFNFLAKLIYSETPKTGFLATRPNFIHAFMIVSLFVCFLVSLPHGIMDWYMTCHFRGQLSKIFIWGGISSDILSETYFTGTREQSCKTWFLTVYPMTYLLKWKFWIWLSPF